MLAEAEVAVARRLASTGNRIISGDVGGVSLRVFLIAPASKAVTLVLLDPLGLAYIGGACRDAGHEVQIYDMANSMATSEVDQLFAEIDAFKPDVVGFTAMTNQFNTSLALARMVKSRHGCPIVFGGWHVSGDPSVVTDPEIDYVVCGEGERTIVELLSHIERADPPLEAIDGLAYKHGDSYMVNKPRARIRDLSTLPRPLRETLRFNQYVYPFYFRRPVSKMRTLSVQASRGCPYECSFCQTPVVWSNLWTKKSASSVVDEIEILAERYEINSLFFRDEEFTIKSSWVMEICREIIRRGLPQYMDWGSYCRVDDITPELAQTLAEAGYVYGFLGIESGDPETRDKLHKYYKQEEAERAIALFDKYDITSHAGMIVGFPWDTEESIEHSLRWILTLPLDFLTVSFATPFPGTQLRKDVKDQGLLLSDNPDCYTLLQPIIQVPRIPMDRLKELPSQISRRFYLRPRYAAHIVKRLIRRPARMQVIAELIYNRLRMGQRTHVLRTDGNRITSAHGSGGSPEAAKSGVSRAVSRQGRAEAISTGTRSA